MQKAAKTYVLVHGAAHGGWCWKHVADGLRRLGHVVFTPTLTGLGERSHLIRFGPTLETFAQDVTQVLRYEELGDVVLVGHSFAGSVISMLADRMPQRLRHLVYLDALVLASGESSADGDPAKIDQYRRRAVSRDGGVRVVPPNPPAQFGIEDAALGEWLAGMLTPQPLQVYFDPVQLDHPLGNGVPATYIACSRPVFEPLESSRKRARELGWKYLEIATGHDAMVTAPDELTRMLAAIG